MASADTYVGIAMIISSSGTAIAAVGALFLRPRISNTNTTNNNNNSDDPPAPPSPPPPSPVNPFDFMSPEERQEYIEFLNRRDKRNGDDNPRHMHTHTHTHTHLYTFWRWGVA